MSLGQADAIGNLGTQEAAQTTRVSNPLSDQRGRLHGPKNKTYPETSHSTIQA